MRDRNRNRKFALVAICAMFGGFLVLAGDTVVAYAQQQDDDDSLPDEKFVRSMLRAFGLRNGQEAGIEYKERPPLVLPPNSSLPLPAASLSPAKKNPAWPDDPDIKKAKAAKKAKAEQKPIGDYVSEVPHERLTPQEWNVGKTNSQATAAPDRAGASQLGAGAAELTPPELGYTTTVWENIITLGGIFKTEKVESKPFVREPSRAALTDPPAGYRTPAPSQPYGLNQKGNGVEPARNADPQTVRGAQ